MLLLTSDGAHDVPKDIFRYLTTTAKSSFDVVDKLLTLAELLGGRDNATVIALPRIVSPTLPDLARGSDFGMIFRLLSPFDELEIWIPATSDHPQHTQPAAIESDEAKQSLSKRKRKRVRRKPRTSADPDADDPVAPTLDIEFPKAE